MNLNSKPPFESLSKVSIYYMKYSYMIRVEDNCFVNIQKPVIVLRTTYINRK